MYVSYEQPFEGKAFTSSQMREVYRDMADKTEYQDFDTWLYDMIKTGIFRIVTKTSNCFETEKRMIQLLNDLNVVSHETLAVKEFTKKAMCNLVIPFRDKYNLTDLQALQVARNELSVMEMQSLKTLRGNQKKYKNRRRIYKYEVC